MMHSPNALPEITRENFVFLPLNDKMIDIQYNQIQTELLGHSYDTNCFNYDLDYKYANFNMRSDCITDCHMKKVSENLNHSELVTSDLLYRKEFLELNRHMKVHPGTSGLHKIEMVECNKKCRPDCKFKYYLWETKERVKGPTDDSVFLTLRHSRIPDVIIRYSPQLSFISFVCNFGGLIGMWLGLSILAIFSHGLLFFNHIFFDPDKPSKMNGSTNFKINFEVNWNIKVPKHSKMRKILSNYSNYSQRFHNNYTEVQDF